MSRSHEVGRCVEGLGGCVEAVGGSYEGLVWCDEVMMRDEVLCRFFS